MVDGEGRRSSTDVEDFNLEPSIKVVPSSASTLCDTVNVFAQDYQNSGQGFSELKIAGQTLYLSWASDDNDVSVKSESIGSDGSGSATFEVPGGLEGVLRIDAAWGTGDDKVSEDSKITIAGAQLNVSKTDALPNETLTVTGNGFGTQTCIKVTSITLDNVPVIVDEESVGCSVGTGNDAVDGVKVSNSGQFVATIILWPAGRRRYQSDAHRRHPRVERGG